MDTDINISMNNGFIGQTRYIWANLSNVWFITPAIIWERQGKFGQFVKRAKDSYVRNCFAKKVIEVKNTSPKSNFLCTIFIVIARCDSGWPDDSVLIRSPAPPLTTQLDYEQTTQFYLWNQNHFGSQIMLNKKLERASELRRSSSSELKGTQYISCFVLKSSRRTMGVIDKSV